MCFLIFSFIFFLLPEYKTSQFSLNDGKPHRINLPKRKRRDWLKDFEKETGPPDHDLDAASEASSEPDYNYEFAQMEVIMKTLNSNGKSLRPDSSVLGNSCLTQFNEGCPCVKWKCHSEI